MPVPTTKQIRSPAVIMEYQPIRRNFVTVVCSAAVGVSSLAGVLHLQHETQSWAKILFLGNIVAAIAYALVFGKNFVQVSLVIFER